MTACNLVHSELQALADLSLGFCPLYSACFSRAGHRRRRTRIEVPVPAMLALGSPHRNDLYFDVSQSACSKRQCCADAGVYRGRGCPSLSREMYLFRVAWYKTRLEPYCWRIPRTCYCRNDASIQRSATADESVPSSATFTRRPFMPAIYQNLSRRLDAGEPVHSDSFPRTHASSQRHIDIGAS